MTTMIDVYSIGASVLEIPHGCIPSHYTLGLLVTEHLSYGVIYLQNMEYAIAISACLKTTTYFDTIKLKKKHKHICNRYVPLPKVVES